MGSESQPLAHLWQNGFRWTEIGMKFWMKLTWKGGGWAAGSWAVITEFWELSWFYLPGGRREKSENVKLGGRGKEGKNISKHVSNHRTLEGGEREMEKWVCKMTKVCVWGEGGLKGKLIWVLWVKEEKEEDSRWFGPPPALLYLTYSSIVEQILLLHSFTKTPSASFVSLSLLSPFPHQFSLLTQ